MGHVAGGGGLCTALPIHFPACRGKDVTVAKATHMRTPKKEDDLAILILLTCCKSSADVLSCRFLSVPTQRCDQATPRHSQSKFMMAELFCRNNTRTQQTANVELFCRPVLSQREIVCAPKASH